MSGVFVTGTDTGVGKTWVSALLVSALMRCGVRAGYMKPVATGVPEPADATCPEDLELVQRHTDLDGHAEYRCPVRFHRPLAPLAAARLEGKDVPVTRIREAWRRLRRQDAFLVVEGVGGVLVPLAERMTVLDLMVEMAYPVLVVARPGLGTINHTLMTLETVLRRSLSVLGFITSGKKDPGDEAAATSAELIAEFSGGVPFLGHVPFTAAIEDALARCVPTMAPVLAALGFSVPEPLPREPSP